MMVHHDMALTRERGVSLFGSIAKEIGPLFTGAKASPSTLVVVVLEPREPTSARAGDPGTMPEPGWEDAAWQ